MIHYNLKRGDKVPEAQCYVCCNDTFMSGWGYARGRINTMVLLCTSYAQAERVAEYCRGRSEQKRIRICSCRPKLRHGVLYTVVDHESYPHWYGAV